MGFGWLNRVVGGFSSFIGVSSHVQVGTSAVPSLLDLSGHQRVKVLFCADCLDGYVVKFSSVPTAWMDER